MTDAMMNLRTLVAIGSDLTGPDATRRRVVEVHSMADEIQIFEQDQLIARHPGLGGRWQRSLLNGHRRSARQQGHVPIPPNFGGELVVRRPLDFYVRSAWKAPSGSLDYAVSLDGPPLSLWRCRVEPGP